jgi:hypothetical protein
MADLFPDELIRKAAAALGVEAKLVKAVAKTESASAAFMPTPSRTPRGLDVSGKPIIQFEGHVFWKYLTKLKVPYLAPAALLASPKTKEIVDATGQPIAKVLPSILYKSMEKKYTCKPIMEWDQLTAARAIHEETANMATSWGAFQIMGFNHEYAGYGSATDMAAAADGLDAQLGMFIDFIKNNPAILRCLKAKDFAGFARLYNGPGYKAYDYDAKLARNYKFASI